MADKYNSRVPLLFKPFGRKGAWAVTIGQTAYFSCGEADVSAAWHRHEDKHKEQWRRDGAVRFIARYLWQAITKGYDRIDYEIEARETEMSKPAA